MAQCPNYNLPQYSQLKAQYGEGAANLAATLFDFPAFQQWKGDEELPRIEGTTVFNNQGEGFDLSPLLQSRLTHLQDEWEVSGQTFSPTRAQGIVEAFNQSRSGKNFVASQEQGKVTVNYSPIPNSLPAFSAIPSDPATTDPLSTNSGQPGNVDTSTLSPSGLGFFDQMNTFRTLIGNRRVKAMEAKNMTKVKELDELLTFLTPAMEEAKAFSGFVDSFHQDMFGHGEEKNGEGQVTRKGRDGNLVRFQKVAQDILREWAKPEGKRDEKLLKEGVRYLEAIGEVVSQVEELRDLKFLHGNDPKQFKQEGSPLYKLDEVLNAKDQIVNLLKQVRGQAVTSQLGKHLGKASQAAVVEYQQKVAQLTKIGATPKAFEDAQAKFEALHWDEARMLKELSVSTEDLSMLGVLLESPSTSKSAIMGAFYRYLEDLFHQAQVKLQPLSQRAYKEYQAFGKVSKGGKLNPDQQFEGLYEEVAQWDNSKGAYTKSLNLVQETDWTKFNQARQVAMEKAQDISDDPDNEQRRAAISAFYRENTVALSVAQREALMADKKALVTDGSWTNREYEDWEKSNWKTSKSGEKYPVRDFQQPRPQFYTNPRYTALQQDQGKKRMYDFILESRRKAQQAYHPSLRNEYLYPSVRKNWKEKVIGSGGKVPGNMGEWWDSTKALFGEDQSHDELKYGNLNRAIPTLYLQPMEASEVSRDILTSMMLEAQAAAQYGARKEAKPLAEVLLDTVKDTLVEKKDSTGKTLFNAGAKLIGLSGVALTDQGETRGGNLAKATENVINRLIYGQEKVEVRMNTPIGEVSADKMVDSMMGMAAIAGVAGAWNGLKAIANHLNAKVSVGLESLIGKNFKPGELARGEARFAKYLASGDALRDTNAGTPVSLTGQLMYQYGAVPGRSEEEFGRHLTQTTGNKAWDMVFGSGLMKIGEGGAQGPMFLAMALREQVTGEDGTVSNLLDAYELGDDDTPRLKPNFAGSWSPTQESDFRNKVQGLSLLLQGNYGHLTKPEASRHVVGRVLLMYKKFLEPAVQRRFGAAKSNQQLGDTTEGHYRTFFREAFTNWRTLHTLLSDEKSPLTKAEQQRVVGAIREFAVIGMLSLLAMALKGLGDDDEDLRESKMYQASLYELLKMESELKFFLPALGSSDQLRIFSSPTALTTPVTKALALSKMVANPFAWNDTYEKGSKFHEKGDYRIAAAFQSLIGWNGFDPARGLAQFQLFNR